MLPVPEANCGPGPLDFVTSWLVESWFTHSTVVPFLTVTVFGLNWMFFMSTFTTLPPAAGAGALDAGALDAGVLVLLLPPPPQPAAASAAIDANISSGRLIP